MENKSNSYESLRENFRNILPKSRLCVYVPFSTEAKDSEIVSTVERCASKSIGMIIPVVCDSGFEYIYPMRLLHVYGVLLEAAKKEGISVALNLEKPIEEAVVRYFDEIDGESVRSRVLLRREYFCSSEETVKIPVDNQVISVVAIEERGGLYDLRQFVENGEVKWKAPRGNWRINRYFCDEDNEQNRVNMLSYDACCRYIEAVISLFTNNFSQYIGNTLCAIAFSDICFSARNRRNWDERFNSFFAEMNGFDPAPYYPFLYDCGENEQIHYKAVLMDCRAKLLRDGIVRALNDTAKKYGMTALGSLSEPKISAPSWTVGDTLLVQSDFPCAVLDKAYLYGMNSVMISTGASLVSGCENVACDIFRDYENLTSDTIYRETMTALTRGANFLMAHLPEALPTTAERNVLSLLMTRGGEGKYAEQVGRLQSILTGGKRITDIGLLYPIYTIHGSTCLYDAPVYVSYEYPDTPDIIDYMTVINSITAYSGHDLSVIHPELMNETSVRGKNITLPGDIHSDIRVLVIPATELISVKSLRKAAEFFDKGGKIIGTGVFPSKAFELPMSDNKELDVEVVELTKHIFGYGVVDTNITCNYIYNKNDAGGESYFLYSTMTELDRTFCVSSAKLYEAICSFDIPYDIYIGNMPRLECTGALNNNYPEYKMLGLASHIRGGGIISHIHKKQGDCDVYLFSNGTDIPYNDFVYLRGAHQIENWLPQNGKRRQMKCAYVMKCGEVYTKIEMKLGAGDYMLLVSDGGKNFEYIIEE